MKILNLGCGKDLMKGAINLDKYNYKGVDLVHDLNSFPYPFKDNYFNKIYARHIIEHLDDFLRVMREIHRILKPKGKVFIKVPHFSSAGSYFPFHKTFFNISSFNQISINESYSSSNLDEENKLFTLISRKIIFYKGKRLLGYLLESLLNKIPTYYERSFLKALFPANSIEFILRKNSKKDARNNN